MCITKKEYNIFYKNAIRKWTKKLYSDTMQYKEVKKLDKVTNKETITKTIRMEPDLIEKIEKLADESERDFTKQVKFMLIEYIRSKEIK